MGERLQKLGLQKPAMAHSVDNSSHYRDTTSPGLDAVYNAVVRRYTKNNRVWEKSDSTVWGGAIYQVIPLFGYSVLGVVLWFLLDKTVELKGATHALLFMMILLFLNTLRMNAALRKMNSKL
jgi:hypothetical protein